MVLEEDHVAVLEIVTGTDFIHQVPLETPSPLGGVEKKLFISLLTRMTLRIVLNGMVGDDNLCHMKDLLWE